jgi:hypothetical protein
VDRICEIVVIPDVVANVDAPAATTNLMLEVGAMARFPNIEQISEPDNRALRLKQAHDAVGRLRILVAHYREQDARSTAAKEAQAARVLLTDLILLFDMEPRLSYDLAYEQIDGSLSFDTDDYIVEARWRTERTDRGDLDIFKSKVERKGRNALGIFVSVNGFTSDALAQYAFSSPFIVFTGEDIFMVFDGRVRLDELIRAKKRPVNETGNCDLPAKEFLV